jgi:1-acyl-sn-glycerol-3-phosphate acyltransferase
MEAEGVPDPDPRAVSPISAEQGYESEPALVRAIAELCADLAPDVGAAVDADTVLSGLGFDSLACAELTNAIEERFGVRLVHDDIDETRTVREVAATVRKEMPERPRIPPGVGRFQQPAKAIAGWAFAWQARLKVEGAEHVPAEGAVIIAANHRAMLDVPLLVIACPRRVTFMAKSELFGDPIRRWGFHVLGGFPVRREIADVRAMDTGLAILERGEVLGLYPEGTRSRSREMRPFLKGAAWLALKSGAPIVPSGISGTERSSPEGHRRPLRKRVRIAFGKPIEVEPVRDARERRERAAELTDQLLEAITTLISQGHE